MVTLVLTDAAYCVHCIKILSKAAAAGSLLEQDLALEQNLAMEHDLAMEQDLTTRRRVLYGSVVLHVEEEEKVDAELETMASVMVASAAEGVEVVWWSKCEEEEEGEEEEDEEESVDDEEFEPRPEFDPGGT